MVEPYCSAAPGARLRAAPVDLASVVCCISRNHRGSRRSDDEIERRYFLKVLGSGAAAALGAACSAEPHGSGAGAGGDGAGGGGAAAAAALAPGGGRLDDDTTGTGTHTATTATSSGTTTTTSSSGTTTTTGDCEMSPVGTKIGMLTAYASMGLHKVSSASVLLGHDGGGYYALTSICTHQGCDMAGSDGFIESPNIQCACHGSEFGPTGAVIQSPAQSPLHAYALALGCDGFLYVNKKQTVASTVRLMA